MATLEFLSEFRVREGQSDVLKAQWYIVAVCIFRLQYEDMT